MKNLIQQFAQTGEELGSLSFPAIRLVVEKATSPDDDSPPVEQAEDPREVFIKTMLSQGLSTVQANAAWDVLNPTKTK